MPLQVINGPRNPLANKLMRLIIAFSIAVSLIATAIQVKLEYDHDIKDVQSRIAQSQEGHLSVITNNLWLLDKERLKIVLHGISLQPDFQYAEVTNEAGEVVAATGAKREADIITLSADLTHEHRGKTLTIGRFVLVANLDVALDNAARNAIFILTITTLIICFLAVIIYIVVYQVLTRHMVHMAAYVHDFSIDTLDQELTLERKESEDDRDELHELVVAINAMRFNLKVSYEKLNALNEQLELRIDETELANQAKADFLASMSHELRTPLNAILGFGQMLKLNPKEPLSPKQTEYMNDIIAGGEHLLDLVNDVLDLVKIEANQIVLSMEHIYSHDVINESISLITPAADAHHITVINRTVKKKPFRIRADALRLKQGLINLLSNAVKYNDDNGRVILDCVETDDGFLRISVIDTGIGIAKEHHEDVFEVFNRVDTDPMKAVEGTGIGLAVTKQLVERMGGRIGFKSEVGEGSTFWIEMPLASRFGVLVWEDSLSIGIDAIDADHKTLISLLDKLTDRTLAKGDVDEVLTELIAYTLQHFRREEAVMEVCGYPDIEQHRASHGKLTASASQLAERWRDDRDPKVAHELLEFLRAWLVKHIMLEDAKIRPFAKGKEAEIERALGEI